jgi:hypothetical protein
MINFFKRLWNFFKRFKKKKGWTPADDHHCVIWYDFSEMPLKPWKYSECVSEMPNKIKKEVK